MDPIELPHQSPSSPPPQPSPPFVQTHHMDLLLDDEPTSVWDFGDLLDFTADDQFPISWDQPPEPECEPENPVPSDLDPDPDPDPPSIASKPSRSRKRDPRMVCSNFLAGRIPCACPELDEKMEEEELPGKKRNRTARASAGVARCQVPSCGADIRELKGYHRRHRVCLRCANAATVVLDGQRKRYCQQCGKFHILSDFDEGKRSCRRKLERHNNRRRRKPADSSRAAAKESQQDVHPDDVGCDDEDGKGDALCLSSQLGEKEASLEPEDGGVSTLRSAPESQSIPSDSVASFIVSREVPTDGAKDNVKYSLSPSCGDNRSAYSSVCPTGRISFKLYDWNPAEFPRRLRHQIFQWLASMPVELEGYIRPGCIILTVFIAMPKSMWKKLYDDPVSYIHDFIIRPGRMLSGRGTVYVYLSDMIFLVKKDGTSVVKVEVGSQVPRLHYVHPMCFEAGKPLEFVACGSDLRQPEFRCLKNCMLVLTRKCGGRFLISFAGKYMACQCDPASSTCGCEGGINCKGCSCCSSGHQLYRIQMPSTEAYQYGPAFIEVENQSGLSNFIPILISDSEVCSEMRMIQQRVDESLLTEGLQFPGVYVQDSCESFAMRGATLSDFVVDIAWLLKEPASENLHHILPVSQIRRFTCLLQFLTQHESTIILQKLLRNLNVLMDNAKSSMELGRSGDADIRLLKQQMDQARNFLLTKQEAASSFVLSSGYTGLKEQCSCQCSSRKEVVSALTITDQDMEMGESNGLRVSAGSHCLKKSECTPLLDAELAGNLLKKKPCNQVFVSSVLRSRPTLYIAAVAAVCFGVCTVLTHPHTVGDIAVSIHRSLFNLP